MMRTEHCNLTQGVVYTHSIDEEGWMPLDAAVPAALGSHGRISLHDVNLRPINRRVPRPTVSPVLAERNGYLG